MYKFFKRLLEPAGKSMGPTPRRRAVRLGVESFESRDVPSASGFGHFLSPPPAGFSHALAAPSESGTLQRVSHTATTQVFTATLTGADGTSGQVIFTVDTVAKTNSLTISASGLTANQTFDVQVGGTSIGSLATDDTGSASTTIANVTAAIAAGAVITVVDTSTTTPTTVLTGTFDQGGCHGSDHSPPLVAPLAGATGTSGTAKFWTDTSAATSTLKVKVAGLTASSTYTVQIDSTTVGTLTTDANGAGSAKLASLTNTVTSGTSTLTILDSTGATVLSGTFATAPGHPRH